MSVSAVAPTPFYQDPERLPIGLPQASGGDTAPVADKAGGQRLSMFAEGDDSPSFWDVLDIINPLQHIPVVGNLYREATDDKIGVGARLLGGTLFGGPLGLIASAIDCMIEEATGQDAGGHMLALFRDEGQSAPDMAPASKVADIPAPPASPAPATADTVSSSPAKAVADNGGAVPAGPVITLPEGAAAGASQPMVFSLDGMQAAPAAQPQTMAAAAPMDLTPVSAPQPATRPLNGPAARMMPVPPRNSTANTQPLPPVTVPISNSGSRSNVPVTGRSPQPAAGVAAAQRAQVSQEALANHPMMPPTDANGQTAAGPDWFTAAWSQALDKYQRANQRNANQRSDGAATSTTSTLQ